MNLIRKLTPRQREILTELASGFSRKEIAVRKGISTRTVDIHLETIYRVLEVHSATQAICKVLKVEG